MKLHFLAAPLLLCQALGSWAWDSRTPLSVSGRWIRDSSGTTVTYAGANWPGHMEAMIPEGLQYASIESSVSKMKSIGMNVIRLTFAIEMVDDIYENGQDMTVQSSLINALGPLNGTRVFEEIRKANPRITDQTTRVQAFDMVAEECNRQGVHVHLDNHVSKATWCCSHTDGNAWFGDTYFDVSNWKRGLQYMASHAQSWPNFVSIGMRNELREPATSNTDYPYTWTTWYNEMTSAAKAIHEANPETLIFFSGLDYDTTLAPIPTASDLGNGTHFRLSDFPFADKMVLEIHNYDEGATSCPSLSNSLWNDGFDALNQRDPSIVNVMPVVMTEFGFSQDDVTWKDVYASCLRNWLPHVQAGWITWVLPGSYYIRQGTQDSDESWGMLNHNWSGWRSPDAINNGLAVMVRKSLSQGSQ